MIQQYQRYLTLELDGMDNDQCHLWGGGPGYGAEADEIWSINEDVLDVLLDEESSVSVPISHGEKARGGALF